MSRRIATFLLVFFATFSLAYSQDWLPPLTINSYGVSTWTNGELQPIDECAQEQIRGHPIPSPNGRYLALTTYIQPPLGLSYTNLPVAATNLWLCDLQERRGHQIARQPERAYTARSEPAWFVDNEGLLQLSWIELTASDVPQQLVLYDLTTGTTEIITTDLPSARVLPSHVLWGQNGITVIPSQFGPPLTIQTYSPDGILLADLALHLVGSAQLGLVSYEGEEYVVFFPAAYENFEVPQLIHPLTGDGYAASLERYSPLAPADSLAATFEFNPDTASYQALTWNVIDVGNVPQPIGYSGVLENLVVSPDGDAVGVLDIFEGRGFIWRSGAVIPLPVEMGRNIGQGSTITWGPQAWRVREILGETTIASIAG